jgi:hypothetical protein
MTEIWKDIGGVYQVSNLGRVKSVGTRISSRVMRLQTRKRDGYVCVGLVLDGHRKTAKVHRLVAEAFLPNPDNLPNVDHINGDKANNRVENLRWASHSLNQRNRHRTFGAVPQLGVAKSYSKANPYRAALCVNGRKQHLGVYPTAEDAHEAYVKAKDLSQ